jgi:hypothetical protein
MDTEDQLARKGPKPSPRAPGLLWEHDPHDPLHLLPVPQVRAQGEGGGSGGGAESRVRRARHGARGARAGDAAAAGGDRADPRRVPDHQVPRCVGRGPRRRHHGRVRRRLHPRDRLDHRRGRPGDGDPACRHRGAGPQPQAVPRLQRQHEPAQPARRARHPLLLRRIHAGAPRRGPWHRRRAPAVAAGRADRGRGAGDHGARGVGGLRDRLDGSSRSPSTASGPRPSRGSGPARRRRWRGRRGAAASR